MINLLQKLNTTHSLELFEYEQLIKGFTPELMSVAADMARRANVYGNEIYIRGLIEISNICKNDCLYCGIRASNKNCERYRLSKAEILECCDEGYRLGFRTFVMQGGEDMHFSDDVMCDIIKSIKSRYPDCAVTLSLGERNFESYKALKEAGADRYLLRHETADSEHYQKLHPNNLSFKNRMRCLNDLKSLGYQVGCGFMVGSPYQTPLTLAKDLKFIEQFKPDMCGIGPFLPHNDTPFANYSGGDTELTLFLLSVIRIMRPNILLPATTALGTADKNGRERGVLAGANVVMPNLSPLSHRKKYMLYNNKISTGEESAQSVEKLKHSMNKIGYKVVTARGDAKGE